MSAPPWRLEIHAQLPSTQVEAAARAAAGAADRLAVMALDQPAGRGRAGRAWASAPGNLHLTALVRPGLPGPQAGEFALVAAVAMHAAARALAPVQLKWPNDLLLDGAKAGGVLTEARVERGRIAWVLCGFGVNLASAPSLPGRAAACLGPIPPETFARALLAELAHWLDRHASEGFGAVRARWMEAGPPIGAPLTVRQGDSLCAGRYEGLDADGALRLLTAGGLKRIVAGEVEGS